MHVRHAQPPTPSFPSINTHTAHASSPWSAAASSNDCLRKLLPLICCQPSTSCQPGMSTQKLSALPAASAAASICSMCCAAAVRIAGTNGGLTSKEPCFRFILWTVGGRGDGTKGHEGLPGGLVHRCRGWLLPPLLSLHHMRARITNKDATPQPLTDARTRSFRHSNCK